MFSGKPSHAAFRMDDSGYELLGFEAWLGGVPEDGDFLLCKE